MKTLLGLPHIFGSLVVTSRWSNQPSKRSSSTIKSHTESGFTLVEILVVVVILSIFAGMMSLSVGSSDSRKNRAFYEHLIDSMQYVRLLSAERMQPMGLSLKADNQGQLTPVIVTLTDPYSAYQPDSAAIKDGAGKNAMELTAMTAEDRARPTWQVETAVTLPEMPDKVSIAINPLDGQIGNGPRDSRVLQPWFMGQDVPQVVWFGTGEATPVAIEIAYDARPVGEVIIVEPNGHVKIGQSP